MADLVIAGPLVVDGTGGPGFVGTVAVTGDRLEAVLREGEPEPPATRRVEASGLVLAPGFIDVHQHSDLSPFTEPGMESYLRQGVTTCVVGNCGSSAFPIEGAAELAALAGARASELGLSWSSFGGYLERVQACRPALNVAALVGHGTLREAVLRRDQRRPPTSEEMAAMRRLLVEALDEGALGLSTGLIYAPGLHATTEEIVELASVLAGRGLYVSHVRGEDERVLRAVDECIEIGRRAGVPSHVSHLKVEGRGMWGRAGELLELLDARRRAGDDVSADQYPYTAWETELAALLPPWVTAAELPEVLGDQEARARLERAIEEGEPGSEGVGRTLGWDRVMLGSFPPEPELSGRSLADLAAERGMPPASLVLELLLADPFAGMLGHGMHEDDVRTILARPDVFVASDGIAVSPEGPLGAHAVHPRYYGTFVRVLGRYVREEGLLPLETAIRKMTALPADRFGLAGRGRIERGAFADLVLFDPTTVNDRATYERPHAFAEGVRLVVVNGRVAFDGEPRERAGRVLRRGQR
ncbi:MAG: aminoacylase [Actinomycetota bacterium]|nr:MAG: aminoacylase [Actinomycetota bacterium]